MFFFWSKSSNAQNSKEAQCEDLFAAVRQSVIHIHILGTSPHWANLQMFEFTNVHDGANVYNGTLYIVQSSRMRVSGAECEDLLGAVKGNSWPGLWSNHQHTARFHMT